MLLQQTKENLSHIKQYYMYPIPNKYQQITWQLGLVLGRYLNNDWEDVFYSESSQVKMRSYK